MIVKFIDMLYKTMYVLALVRKTVAFESYKYCVFYCMLEGFPLILRFDIRDLRLQYFDTKEEPARVKVVNDIILRLSSKKSTTFIPIVVRCPHTQNMASAEWMGLYFLICMTACRSLSVQIDLGL